MKELHDKIVPSPIVIQDLIEFKIPRNIHFVQASSHFRGDNAENGKISRSGRGLLETFLDGAQTFKGPSRVGATLNLHRCYDLPVSSSTALEFNVGFEP